MNQFSKTSLDRLVTCDIRLIRLMKAVLDDVDITILCGHRNEAEQNKAFAEGKSKLQYPHGKHNSLPSKAVDIAPYPVDFNDLEAFRELAVVVKEKAEELGIAIRWGGDWDNNPDTPNKFNDFPHFEIIGD